MNLSNKYTWAAWIAVLTICTTMRAAPPVPGAIFTTNSDCSGVNLNIYGSKDQVYLNGGPAHPGAANLPDGQYYVQVTDPSGSCVLGTSGNTTPFVVSNGVANCIQLCSVLTQGDPTCAAGVDTCGYNTTPNSGGEYKAWVSNDPTFTNSSTKTDNFKVLAGVPPPPPENGSLCIYKFYDANANGLYDAGELIIAENLGASPATSGWEIFVGGAALQTDFTTTTCVTLSRGVYDVSEASSITGNWVHTGSIVDGTPQVTAAGSALEHISITIQGGDSHTVYFGNVCLGAGGGLTLGFWSNPNGQRVLNSSDLTFLSGLCLRNGSGNDFNPTTSTSLKNWLLGANATNMAYMLSAQLAAMELNVRHNPNPYGGGVDGNSLVYAPCLLNYAPIPGLNGLGFISINNLMTAANAELCLHGSTPSGNQYRAYQECLKNTLDSANNNLNFSQSTPCSFSFAP